MRILTLLLAAGVLSACTHNVSSEETDLIIQTLGITPGDKVADIGAGSGDHAAALAQAAGSTGHVYATEIDAGSLASMRNRFTGTANITVVDALVDATGLQPGCCNAILMRTVFHHLDDPAPVLADVHHNLRPGGRFLVIDFEPSALLSLWTPEGHDAHGATPATIAATGRTAGFRIERKFEPWPRPGLEGLLMNHHAVLMVKD